MKKFLIISICFILTFSCFRIFSLSKNTAKAVEDYENYLISPTAIAVSENKLFVYDEWENEIILYDLSSKERVSSITLSGVSKLKIVEDKLYALTKTSETETNINVYSLSLQEIASFNLRTNNNYIDFVISATEIKTITDDGDIQIYSLNGSTLNYQYTRESSAWNFEGLVSRTIIGMDCEDNIITLTFSKGVYTYNTQTHENIKTYSLPSGAEITHATKTHALLSTGEVVKLENSEVVAEGLMQNCSAISNLGEKVYLTNKNSHQVFIIEDGQISDLGLNPAVHPNLFSANNFKHIKLTTNQNLKLKPYSINASRIVEAGKHLTVIGETENYYYCLYVGAVNEFLYLEKSTNNFEIIEIGSSSSTYVVTIPSQIRSLPSSEVQENSVLASVHAGETVVVKNATIIKNSKDELFYMVEVNETFGFIKYSAVQSTRGNYELTTPCNAKIKRATTLFENADGTSIIITLEKGTRIAMQEETAPTKDYIRIEYQDTNGIIYSGYVLADDIDPDGLSTLQILGLVLVGTNLALLITILAIKRNSRKWKV